MSSSTKLCIMATVYKKLQKDRIAVLELLPDSLTNEAARGSYVVNPDYAKYRTNKVRVVRIYNMFNPAETYSKGRSLWRHGFIYRVGEVVEEKNACLDAAVCAE